MTTDTTRHYAEKVRDTLKAIAEADERNLDALTAKEFDTTEYKVAAREARGLRAALLLHAANLAEAVLAEEAQEPTHVTRCQSEFAGHACGLHGDHDGKHFDTLTCQTW